MKTTRTRLILLVSFLSLSVPVLGATMTPPELLAGIDAIFAWTTPSSPGCSVAVAKDGKIIVDRAYGSADLERDVPLSTDSVLDAGSITKQFVAAAVLLLAGDGKLSLTDDVRKHIPELPDYGHEITIDHLLTHTSGIRDWTGMMPLVDGDIDALALTLRQKGLNFAPGTEWAYSNGGYVLLKEIVTRTSGMSFGAFTRTRLFEPLEMTSTSYRGDLREIVPDRALAYEMEDGSWRLAILLDNDRGGGGALFTTSRDLLLWNEALTTARLGEALTAKLHEPARLSNGRALGYSRGLFLDEGRSGRVIWHTGSADGYKSVLSRYPEQGLSIAIMCNSGDDTNRLSFARQIFDLLVSESDAPAGRTERAVSNAVAVDPERRSGLFVSPGITEPLRLVADDGRLRIAGGPVLVAETEERFRNPEGALSFMSEDEFVIRFISDDEIELRSMEGKTTRYRRAKPWRPSAEKLDAFSGRYVSEEIGTVFQFTAEGGELEANLAHAPEKTLPLRPLYQDVFQWRRMLFRFERDAEGRIIGLYYSNPLLRDVEFIRQR